MVANSALPIKRQVQRATESNQTSTESCGKNQVERVAILGVPALAFSREQAAESPDFAAWETNSYESQDVTDDTRIQTNALTSGIFSVRFMFI